MKLVCGNSNRPLAEAIANYLNTPLTQSIVRRFSDMEIFVEIQENVRGQDMFVIQSTSYPANDNLMELLIIIDCPERDVMCLTNAFAGVTGWIPSRGSPGGCAARGWRSTSPMTIRRSASSTRSEALPSRGQFHPSRHSRRRH